MADPAIDLAPPRRRDRADADAVAEHLPPDGLHEAVDRPLRRGVDRLPRRREVGGERAGDDDVAAAARDALIVYDRLTCKRSCAGTGSGAICRASVHGRKRWSTVASGDRARSVPKRDYSLIGRGRAARRRDRAEGGRVVSHRRAAQGDEGADAARRPAGDPRHHHLARVDAGLLRHRDRALVRGHPWLSVPFWLAYGVLYGSASDSRWHECGHGTAFKTPWMNDAVYQIACFMIIRNPYDLELEPHPPPHRHRSSSASTPRSR